MSPLEAFSAIGDVKYATGCLDASCSNDTYFSEAKKAAKHAEATIIFVGTDLSIEAEFIDRVNFLLPGNQTKLVKQVAKISKGPVILVVLSGSNIDVSFAKNNPKISAILWIGFPGEQGGNAIADVVFGKYNPGTFSHSLPLNIGNFKSSIRVVRPLIMFDLSEKFYGVIT